MERPQLTRLRRANSRICTAGERRVISSHAATMFSALARLLSGASRRVVARRGASTDIAAPFRAR